MKLEKIKEKLSKSGLKATQQRLVIYQKLQSFIDKHPTAEQIYESLHEQNPTLSLGTVYKTLDTFTDVGLIERIPSEGGKMRYDANLTPHNHIFCKESEEIIDLYDEELDGLLKAYFMKKDLGNLSIDKISVHIQATKTNA